MERLANDPEVWNSVPFKNVKTHLYILSDSTVTYRKLALLKNEHMH